jgi:hypothetical protein
MASGHAVSLLLLSILIGLVLGVVIWGFFLQGQRRDLDHAVESGDDLIIGLLVLAAFALGTFLTYALLGVKF